MYQVSIIFTDGTGLTCIGDVTLDAAESSLYLYGEAGSYMNFNWQHICYYAVSKVEEDD